MSQHKDEHFFDTAGTLAAGGEVAENLAMLASKGTGAVATKVVPGMQVAVSGLGSVSEYNTTIDRYQKQMGRDPEHLKNGYALNCDYDPELESAGKAKANAGISFGKGVFLAAIGIPCMLIPGIGWAIAASITACFVGSWAYDKVVGHSKAQDPLMIAGAMREKRNNNEEIPQELVFGLMITSLNPQNTFRKELEERLKSATGTTKLDEILDNPDKHPALSVIMQDPAVVEKMCEHYGVLPDPQFFERVTGLYNQGLVNTRSILYAHSGDVSLACMQDQQLQKLAPQQQPAANLAALPPRSRDAQAGLTL